jgi:gliding motility-associated-like protein
LDIFITSSVNTSGTVSLPQQGWSVDFDVVANQTTTVNVPNAIGETINPEVISNTGIYVSTEDTVSVFAINMEQYTADGTKILPIQSIGTEYRVAAYHGIGGVGSEFLIVATQDDTEIEITPSATTTGGLVAGTTFTINMDAGETYMLQSLDESDLTGSYIVATEESGDCRPFSVFGGCYCANIPTGCTACDHIFDQNFAVETWGSEYETVPFASSSSYTYRVLAHEDGTDVFINGVFSVTLNAGEFEEYNTVTTADCISGSNPMAVIQYMQGVTCSVVGDPAMLVLNDVSQKIDNVTFSTVSSTIIDEHSVNVVVASIDVGQVLLDGVTLDPALFTQYAFCPESSYASFEVTQGSHTLEAENGFSAYIYGTGNAESYAYSAGSFSTPDLISTVDSVICANDTINIGTSLSLFDIYWYAQGNPDDTLATGPILTLIPPIIPDIYVAKGNLLISGCEEEQWFLIESPEPPVVSVYATDPVICQYSSTQLNVSVDPPSPLYTYAWSPAAGLDNPNIANPIATPLETTTYSVLVSTPTGCGFSSEEVTVQVLGGVLAGLSASTDDDAICTDEIANLLVTVDEVVYEDNFDPGVSWGLWCDIQNGAQSNDCGSVSGNALYFNGAGDRWTTTEAINCALGGLVSFTIKFGSGAAPCDDPEPGDNVALEYSTTGCAGPFTQIILISESAYTSFETVSAAIPAGAQTATTHFRWRQIANSGNNTDNWSLDDVYVSALTNNAYDYAWTPEGPLDDPTIVDPEASPLVDTMFYVELTDNFNGCQYTDSVFISVGQSYTVDLPNDTVLCDIAGIELYANPSIAGNFGFQWSPGDGTLSSLFSQTPTASPLVTAVYSVEVTSTQGCITEGEVTITVNQLLSLDVTTDNTDFCQGDEANLVADVAGTAGLEFTWTPAQYLDDASSSTPTASPVQDTWYEVLVTDPGSDCFLLDSVEVIVFSTFAMQSLADTTLCESLGFELTTTVDTADPLTYTWQPALNLDDAAAQSPSIILDEATQYIVVAEDAGGCAQTDTVNVSLVFQTFELGPDIELCLGQSDSVNTGYDNSFIHSWSTFESTTGIQVSTSGWYIVEVTGPENCVRSDSLEVFVNDLPEFELGPDIISCEGYQETLTIPLAGVDYLWSNEQVTASINVTVDGTYSANVTDGNGCEYADSLFVDFHELPILDLPVLVDLCEGENIVLDAENPGSSYLWNTTAASQQITASTSGIYSVLVTNAFDCFQNDETEVVVHPYPAVWLGADHVMCQNDFYDLDVNNPAASVLWSTGDTTQVITIWSSGTYEVSVNNGYCSSTDEINVVVNPLPYDPLGFDTVMCFTEAPYLTLFADNPGGAYVWSGDEIVPSTDPSIDVNSEGVYSLFITTPFGCIDQFEIAITDICPGQLFIPNSFSPNGDGMNDYFFAYGSNIVEFEMKIWDRWGENVFVGADIDTPWLGDVFNGAHYADSETYVYVITYKYLLDIDGNISDTEQVTGHVTLIR